MAWQGLAWDSLGRAAIGGLVVLGAGSLAARFCRQPVRRVRLVVLTMLGALVVPGLGMLPITPRWSFRLPSPMAWDGSEGPARNQAEARLSTSSNARPP